MLPLLALVSELESRLAELVQGILLVAGGFLIGYHLGGLIGWSLGKWVLRMKDRTTPRQLGQPIGGVILALIVAIIVFTGHGKGPGAGGEGTGPTLATGTNPNGPANNESETSQHSITSKPPEITTPEKLVRVTVFGGSAVTGDCFYQFEDDKTLKTLDEIKQLILTQRNRVKGKTSLAILFPPDKDIALPQEHPMVTRLAKWAREEAGLDVSFPASR
jgi:hypothetical protein